MSATANYSTTEIFLAVVVAVVAEAGGFLLLKTGGGTQLKADISNERAQPISVSITPVVDDLPLLKLGSTKPSRLPDRWVAPRAVPRAQEQAVPSPHAVASAHAIPTAHVTDAGAKPPPPQAEIVKQADITPPVADPGPPPASTVVGAADGVKEGTETDPLKAHAIDFYKAQLDSWFSSKFRIRGKVPFDDLKDLRASVRVSISPDRTVTSFTIVKPSGNATFDGELANTLNGIVASGAELPSPPPNYPDILKSTQSFSFRCTNRSLCE